MPTPTPTHPHSYLPSLLPVPTSTYPRHYISLLLPIPIRTYHHPLKSTPTYPNGSLPPSTHPFQPLLYLPICTHFLKGVSCSLLGTNTGLLGIIYWKNGTVSISFFFSVFQSKSGLHYHLWRVHQIGRNGDVPNSIACTISKPFQCAYCNHTSGLSGNIRKHVKNIHSHLPIKYLDLRKQLESDAVE